MYTTRKSGEMETKPTFKELIYGDKPSPIASAAVFRRRPCGYNGYGGGM